VHSSRCGLEIDGLEIEDTEGVQLVNQGFAIKLPIYINSS
jgi:hypothetical protein